MNLLKALTGYRLVSLPEVPSTVTTMPGQHAYLCLDTHCQTVMERAPKGRCEKCGQSCIVPVQHLVLLARQWAWQQKKEQRVTDRRAKEQKPHPGKDVPRNLAYELTASER